MTDFVFENHEGIQFFGLDKALKTHLGADTALSAGHYGICVHVAGEPTKQQKARLDAIVSQHGALRVTANRTLISADSTDKADILCADPALDQDDQVTYTVWLNDREYTAPAEAAVVNGRVELALVTEHPGTYVVEIARQGKGNYETGYLTIEAEA